MTYGKTKNKKKEGPLKALNSTWDFDALRASLKALQVEDFNLEITGFSIPVIEELILPKETKRLEKASTVEKSRDHNVRCPKCGCKFPIE